MYNEVITLPFIIIARYIKMPKIQISEKGQRNEAIKVEYIISFHIALITFINSDKIISAVSVLHRFDYFHSLHIIHITYIVLFMEYFIALAYENVRENSL